MRERAYLLCKLVNERTGLYLESPVYIYRYLQSELREIPNVLSAEGEST